MERTQRVVYHMWTTLVTTGKSIDDTDTYTITLDINCLFKQQATVSYHTVDTFTFSPFSPLLFSPFLPCIFIVFVAFVSHHIICSFVSRFFTSTLCALSLSLSPFTQVHSSLKHSLAPSLTNTHFLPRSRLLLLFQLTHWLFLSLSVARWHFEYWKQQEFEQTQHLPLSLSPGFWRIAWLTRSTAWKYTHSLAALCTFINSLVLLLELYWLNRSLVPSSLFPSPFLPEWARWNFTLIKLILSSSSCVCVSLSLSLSLYDALVPIWVITDYTLKSWNTRCTLLAHCFWINLLSQRDEADYFNSSVFRYPLVAPHFSRHLHECLLFSSHWRVIFAGKRFLFVTMLHPLDVTTQLEHLIRVVSWHFHLLL